MSLTIKSFTTNHVVKPLANAIAGILLAPLVMLNILLPVAFAAAIVGALGFIVYIAIHFIIKFW